MKRTIISAVIILPLLLSGCTKVSKSAQSNNGNKQISVNKADNIKKPSVTSKDSKNGLPDKAPTETSSENSTSLYTEFTPLKLSDADVAKLSRKEISWWTDTKANETRSPEMPADLTAMLKKYHGYYVGDTSKKEIYLTFDCGYANEYTTKILDVLKQNNVKASFFVTTPCINGNKDVVKRMVDEGHVVGNHSTTHPNPPGISIAGFAAQNKSKFDNELIVAQNAFESVTGTKMHKFFRPPAGVLSELSLYYTQLLGYRTIVWSFAYSDYNTSAQPDPVKSKQLILGRTHSGGIYLLHGISKTNADILDDLIKTWKSKGYEFKTLDQLP